MIRKLYLLLFVLSSNIFAMDHTKILIQASKDGDIETIKKLIENNYDINVRDINNGHTALIWASRKGHVNIVNLLLESGADVNELTNIGMTALMWAKIFSQHEVIKILKEHGAIE